MNEFSAGSCIRFGWETFKKRPWFFVFAALVIGILEGGIRSSYQTSYQTNTAPHFSPTVIVFFIILGVIAAIITVYARMGRVQLSLRSHDNVENVGWKDVWAPHPFWRFIGGGVLTGLIVLVGFILVIIPGIIFSLRYMFVPYVIMDKGLRPVAALHESARITYGYKWDLLGLFVLLLLLNVIGLICLVVGLLVTGPVSWLAMAHAYRTLEQKAGPAPVA